MLRFYLVSLGIGAVAAACGDGSGASDAAAAIKCGPLMYILDDTCRPLRIGAPADATAANIDASATEVDATDVDSAGGETQDVSFDALIDLTCDGGQPVQACVQYFAAVSACFKKDLLALACQDSLIPTSDAAGAYAAIEQLCLDNLRRFQSGCR